MILKHSENPNFLEIVSCSQVEYKCLTTNYTKFVKGYQYRPTYIKKHWDGKLTFMRYKYIPFGSWSYLNYLCREFNMESNVLQVVEPTINKLDYSEFESYCLDLMKDSKYTPRDYQIQAAWKIIKYKKCMAQLATSAGKTLITFLVFSYLVDRCGVKKILMVVPTVPLVRQACKDFEDYKAGKFSVCEIYAGQKDDSDKCIITVGTFQSLCKKPKEYFDKYGCCMVDECHRMSAISESKIIELCDCQYKWGLSGTVPTNFKYADALQAVCLLGPLVVNIKASDLQDLGFISKCFIHRIILDYSHIKNKKQIQSMAETRKLIKTIEDTEMKARASSKLYASEKNFIVELNSRLDYITDLVTSLKGNTLILVHHIAYLEKLEKNLKLATDAKVYTISGTTSYDNRDFVKDEIENNQDCIMLATFGTCSTGINITNLNNLILAESFKSQVIVLQSIGRLLRKNAQKTIAMIYDICDNIYRGCAIYKHASERKKLYDEQKFKYDEITNKLKY